MSNDQKRSLLGTEPEESNPENSTRARNRTVMMTPDMAGNMRSQWSSPLLGAPNQQPVEAEQEPSRFVSKQLRTASGSIILPDPAKGFSNEPADRSQDSDLDSDSDADWVRPINNLSEAGAELSPGEQWAGVVSVESGFAVQGSQQKQVKTPSQPQKSEHQFSDEHQAVWANTSKLVGFLVAFDENTNGSYVELRVGRIIVTSQSEGSGSHLLINHKSVSPMHAIMRISADGSLQLLDQLSEFGTTVIRFGSGEQEQLSGDKTAVYHGDQILFGEKSYKVCLIAVYEGH